MRKPGSISASIAVRGADGVWIPERAKKAFIGWFGSALSTVKANVKPVLLLSVSRPEIDDSIEIEIEDKDVRTDTYRASGAGGQHVNKTDSAIRLTHVPTNTVVQCQSERSQHQNKATAWKMLRAKMARFEEEKREAEEAKKYGTQPKSGFGSQIRNYFLHPDQRVKDARTGHYVGNFNSVMDGSELQGFFDAFLRWRAGKE